MPGGTLARVSDEKGLHNPHDREVTGMERKFNTRGFTTFLVSLSFLLLAVSGVILYVTPRGRTANWTGWTMLGLSKHEWGALHITVALLFLTLAALHLYFNWRVFLRYFRTKVEEGLCLKRELAAAVVLGALFVGGTLGGLPPFQTLVDLNEDVKNHWERTSVAAPVAHAEDLDLDAFARTIDKPLDEVVATLRAKGFDVPDETASVGKVAARNRVAPNALYEAVGGSAPDHSPGNDRHAAGGFGWGRLTLERFCANEGLDMESVAAKLRERGVGGQGNDDPA